MTINSNQMILCKQFQKTKRIKLACSTQEEIGKAVDCTQPNVKSIIDSFIKLVSENQTYKAAASHIVAQFGKSVLENQTTKASEICSE